jgi:hypothetical protein
MVRSLIPLLVSHRRGPCQPRGQMLGHRDLPRFFGDMSQELYEPDRVHSVSEGKGLRCSHGASLLALPPLEACITPDTCCASRVFVVHCFTWR